MRRCSKMFEQIRRFFMSADFSSTQTERRHFQVFIHSICWWMKRLQFMKPRFISETQVDQTLKQCLFPYRPRAPSTDVFRRLNWNWKTGKLLQTRNEACFSMFKHTENCRWSCWITGIWWWRCKQPKIERKTRFCILSLEEKQEGLSSGLSRFIQQLCLLFHQQLTAANKQTNKQTGAKFDPLGSPGMRLKSEVWLISSFSLISAFIFVIIQTVSYFHISGVFYYPLFVF